MNDKVYFITKNVIEFRSTTNKRVVLLYIFKKSIYKKINETSFDLQKSSLYSRVLIT